MKSTIPFVVFAALTAMLAAGLERDPRHVPSPLVGEPSPAFELPHLMDAEQMFSPAEMRGRVWLLNVWASWCTGCRTEHPLLMALAGSGVVPVLGLNYKDAADDARRFLDARGDPYILSVRDSDGRVGIDYGVYGVPETYVIDENGIIRYKHIGPVTFQALEEEILPRVTRTRE